MRIFQARESRESTGTAGTKKLEVRGEGQHPVDWAPRDLHKPRPGEVNSVPLFPASETTREAADTSYIYFRLRVTSTIIESGADYTCNNCNKAYRSRIGLYSQLNHRLIPVAHSIVSRDRRMPHHKTYHIKRLSPPLNNGLKANRELCLFY